MLRQNGLDQAVLEAGAVPLRSLLLHCGALPLAVPLPGGLVISRAVLDGTLTVAARRAGAHLLEGTIATVSLDEGCPRVILSCGGDRRVVRAGVVIAADGLSGSSLRGIPGFEARSRARSLIGVGAILNAAEWDSAPAPGKVRMHVGHGGYVGLVRLPGGAINLAAALAPALIRDCGGPSQAVRAVLRECGVSTPTIPSNAWRGAPLLHRRRPVSHSAGVFLAGDSAGFVEPFTGEGLSWALLSGYAVADLARAHLAGDALAAHRWREVHAQLLGRRQRICGAICTALRSPLLVRGAIRLGAWAPGAVSALAAALAKDPDWRVLRGNASEPACIQC